MSALEITILTGLALVGVIGSYWDIRFRILPNWLCAITLFAGLAISLYSGGLGGAGAALIHALIALAVCIGLWAAGAIGGGDAKFYAAIASWFPFWSGILLMIAVVLCGLGLLLLTMAFRRVKIVSSKEKSKAHSKLPYGVAISIGASVTFALPIFSGS